VQFSIISNIKKKNGRCNINLSEHFSEDIQKWIGEGKENCFIVLGYTVLMQGIVQQVRLFIFSLCEGKDWDWKGHIESVVKYSKILAKKLHADEEVCEISAWLHDTVKVRDPEEAWPTHHIIGAREAEMMLRKLGYPEEKIKMVHHCILTHSSDKTYMPETLEARITASADAMAHFDNFLALAHAMFGLENKNVPDARDWLVKKIEKCWNKTMPEGKEMVKDKYEAIKVVLGVDS